ncbi:hypothetical protein SAMN04489712_106297 [Thermomonospora echinospora]|uniref:Uncharacterized protein n=1 Tax=Thermomonospora echinospora TaxID=1992 RepID=A0A1H6B5Y5_9ACTN|nr:hypothetical protein SAMN04489712_106297 [Thermomonospora echinospora]
MSFLGGIGAVVLARFTDVISGGTGWLALQVGIIATLVFSFVGFTLFGREAKNVQAQFDRRFAEQGIRGAARVVNYRDPGPGARKKNLIMHMELELELPDRIDPARWYWGVVPSTDIARLTTAERLPCLVLWDGQALVRLYARQDIAAPHLDGEYIDLAPRTS